MSHTKRQLLHAALALLLLSGRQPALAANEGPLQPDQIAPGPNAANAKRFPPGMLGTYVRALFSPTEAECFTMSGLFALGLPSSVSLLFSHEGPTRLSFKTKREGDVVTTSIDDGACRIRIAASKEVRDGEHWLALHASEPPPDPDLLARATRVEPGETKTVAPGATVSVDPKTGKAILKMGSGGTYLTVGLGFPNDPQPQCLQRKDFFTVSQRGLNIWFLSPRDELPFAIEEQLLPAERGKLIRFATSTCRLSMRVIKEIRSNEVWIPLEPTE